MRKLSIEVVRGTFRFPKPGLGHPLVTKSYTELFSPGGLRSGAGFSWAVGAMLGHARLDYPAKDCETIRGQWKAFEENETGSLWGRKGVWLKRSAGLEVMQVS